MCSNKDELPLPASKVKLHPKSSSLSRIHLRCSDTSSHLHLQLDDLEIPTKLFPLYLPRSENLSLAWRCYCYIAIILCFTSSQISFLILVLTPTGNHPLELPRGILLLTQSAFCNCPIRHFRKATKPGQPVPSDSFSSSTHTEHSSQYPRSRTTPQTEYSTRLALFSTGHSVLHLRFFCRLFQFHPLKRLSHKSPRGSVGAGQHSHLKSATFVVLVSLVFVNELQIDLDRTFEDRHLGLTNVTDACRNR